MPQIYWIIEDKVEENEYIPISVSDEESFIPVPKSKKEKVAIAKKIIGDTAVSLETNLNKFVEFTLPEPIVILGEVKREEPIIKPAF